MKTIDEVELKEYFSGREDIEFAVLFGSHAKRHSNKMSDIDIGIFLKNSNNVEEIGDKQIDITCAVMRIHKISNVDIVVLNLANPFLLFQIIKYCKLIYARDEKVFYRFKADSFLKYQDIKPMYDLYDKAAENSLRRGLNG